MSNRKAMTKATLAGRYNAFPPEADVEFAEVPVEQIADWRQKLAEEFGFGSGKWKTMDDAVA